MPSCQRIVLVGFMGAGKSTIARLLAGHLGWQPVDLDEVIVSQSAQSIAAIFAEKGEAYFRNLETACLSQFLTATPADPIVLALGGGAVESAANRELLKNAPATRTFYLHAPLPVLLERCMLQQLDPTAATRPLLASPQMASPQQAHELWQQRTSLYESVGTRITTEGKNAAAVTDCILRLLASDGILKSQPER